MYETTVNQNADPTAETSRLKGSLAPKLAGESALSGALVRFDNEAPMSKKESEDVTEVWFTNRDSGKSFRVKDKIIGPDGVERVRLEDPTSGVVITQRSERLEGILNEVDGAWSQSGPPE